MGQHAELGTHLQDFSGEFFAGLGQWGIFLFKLIDECVEGLDLALAFDSFLVGDFKQVAVVLTLIFEFFELFFVIRWQYFTLFITFFLILFFIIWKPETPAWILVFLSCEGFLDSKRLVGWLFCLLDNSYKFILMFWSSFLDTGAFLCRPIGFVAFERKFAWAGFSGDLFAGLRDDRVSA